MDTNQHGLEIDPEVFQGFLEESMDSLAALDALFVKLEQNPMDVAPVHTIFRAVHSIKGNAPFFGLMQLKAFAHELESLLALVRDRKVLCSNSLTSHLLACVDKLKDVFGRLTAGGPEVQDPARYQSLLQQTREFAASAAAAPLALDRPTEQPADAETETQSFANNPGVAGGGKSMRIPEERIDTFLEFVGELVVVGEMLRHLMERLEMAGTERQLLKDFAAANDVFGSLSNGLERAIMSIRKVSLRGLLQKVPRLARDVATARAKEVVVEIEGEDTEIDKSLFDLLDAPLTHMVRNAVDHGLEMPEQRESVGKARAGRVRVRCEEQDKFVVLTVADDGAGLNYAGLTKKAESLGLIKPGRELSEAEVVDLLFMAGVSTAQEVSDISGRGVGMDVVKRSIEAAGGSISVSSQAGQGTTFTIKVVKSVTTQILQGFIVAVQDQHFVLPMERVLENWFVQESRQHSVLDGARFVVRHDLALPLLDLADLLRIPRQEPGHLAVTVNTAGRDIALVVDRVLGTRQLVLKNINGLPQGDKMFLGGALLGDGSVALVVDVERLAAGIPELNGLRH